jgi:hypothetical protein
MMIGTSGRAAAPRPLVEDLQHFSDQKKDRPAAVRRISDLCSRLCRCLLSHPAPAGMEPAAGRQAQLIAAKSDGVVTATVKRGASTSIRISAAFAMSSLKYCAHL